MIDEFQLVPYAASALPAGPYLIFAPHPDDETLGMGGAIALAAQAGIACDVVVMTDGGQGGEPTVRNREARAATDILQAIPHFWPLADRELAHSDIPIDWVATLLSEIAPGTLFLPSAQEFHPDHRAATARIEAILRSLNYSGNIWLYEIARQGEINRLIDVSSVIDRKISAIRCYQSQLDQLNYEAVTLSIDRARAITLGPGTSHAEGFWALENWPQQSLYDMYLTALKRYF